MEIFAMPQTPVNVLIGVIRFGVYRSRIFSAAYFAKEIDLQNPRKVVRGGGGESRQ